MWLGSEARTDGLLRGVMRLTYEDAVGRLMELAGQVEADPELTAHEEITSAAARALGGSTNVFSADEPDGRTWFPFSTLIFSEIPAKTPH